MVEEYRVKISSNTTWFYKRIIPLIVFFVPTYFLIKNLVWHQDDIGYFSIAFLFGCITFCTVVFAMVFNGFPDAVYDCGDRILVRNNKREEYVFLTDILTISLREPSRGAILTLYPLSTTCCIILKREIFLGQSFVFLTKFHLQETSTYRSIEIETLQENLEKSRPIRNAMKAYEKAHDYKY